VDRITVLVVTVSDTRSVGDDATGDVLEQKLGGAGFVVRRLPPVRDDLEVLRELVRSAAARGEDDVIVLGGGTGLAPRDVTPEAVEPLFDKRIDGFGEEFRRRSWSAPSRPGSDTPLGARAMLSRATAGVVGRAIVVALPGSPAAAELGASLLVEVLPHAVAIASGRHGHGHDGEKA
jgi:molybdenum cofactor biosynthesis protein B